MLITYLLIVDSYADRPAANHLTTKDTKTTNYLLAPPFVTFVLSVVREHATITFGGFR